MNKQEARLIDMPAKRSRNLFVTLIHIDQIQGVFGDLAILLVEKKATDLICSKTPGWVPTMVPYSIIPGIDQGNYTARTKLAA